MCSTERTNEATKEYYIAAMGVELGEAFHALWNQCVLLHLKWDQFVSLFGPTDRVELLNRVAPGLFRLIEDAISDEILLHIWRLLDDDRRTLSLRRLVKLTGRDPVIQQTLQPAVEDATGKAGFAKEWRDKRIAHLNFEHALNRNAVPLAPADQEAIDRALDAIANALGLVEMHYCGTLPTGFRYGAAAGNADGLIAVLKEGVRRWET